MEPEDSWKLPRTWMDGTRSGKRRGRGGGGSHAVTGTSGVADAVAAAFPGGKKVSRADVIFESFLSQDPASRQWSLWFRALLLPHIFNRSRLCMLLRIAWSRQPQAQSWYESGQYNFELQVWKWRCSVQLYQRVSRYSTFMSFVLFKGQGTNRSKALNCEWLGNSYLLFHPFSAECLYFISFLWAFDGFLKCLWATLSWKKCPVPGIPWQPSGWGWISLQWPRADPCEELRSCTPCLVAKKEAVPSSWPCFSLDRVVLFTFLIAETLSKLAVGERAATEELLALLEEGVWAGMQQQEAQRCVSCSPASLSGDGAVPGCSCPVFLLSDAFASPPRPYLLPHVAYFNASCHQWKEKEGDDSFFREGSRELEGSFAFPRALLVWDISTVNMSESGAGWVSQNLNLSDVLDFFFSC